MSRKALACVAWTCLSQQTEFWDQMVTYDLRGELGRNAGPEPGAMERRLVALSPVERLARMPTRRFWGPAGQGFAHAGNPLAPFLERLTALPRLSPATSPRVKAAVQRKAAGTFPAETAPEHRQQQQRGARRRLGRALAVGEAFTTTDLFAAVAQHVMWAIQGGLTIRACPHPGCGRAFIPETGRHRYCPEHRSGTARSERARSPRPGIAPWES